MFFKNVCRLTLGICLLAAFGNLRVCRAQEESANSSRIQEEPRQNYHALYDANISKARGLRTAAVEETPGHRQLRNEFRDVDVTYDPVLQVPNRVSVRGPASRRLADAKQTAEDAATSFLQQRGAIWKLGAADVSTLTVEGVSERGLKTVQLKQRVGGVEVFGSEVRVALSGMNEVMSVSGILFAEAGSEGNRRQARSERPTTETDAVAVGLSDLLNRSIPSDQFRSARPRQETSDYRFVEMAGEDTSLDRPVRVKDVLFPLGDGSFVPAYYMELWPTGKDAFSYVVAADGSSQVLFRKNLTSRIAFEYRVHNTGIPLFRPLDGPAPGTPHPSGTPDGFQASTVAEQLIRIESLLSGRPWLPPSATTTDGNNCRAYADLSPPDGFQEMSSDVFGKVTSTGRFDYVYDHTKPSDDENNLQNSTVGMFFHVNWLHDRWYEAGFDEAAGNAQKDNFGLGGVANDPILAEGNDASGNDNANMATPADGASPKMQMYEFVRPPGPSRTSNHEALITFHEMGHYITNRLVGDANGLWNRQGRAMGEGWGDFFAICMTSQSGDSFADGVFAVGGWTDLTPTFADNYYYSIRRYPYSADMSRNPLTFAHIQNTVALPTGPPRQDFGSNNDIHNAGEVWCSMLWEVFVGLVQQHGHATAEERMLEYVIGGLKQTPNSPTFTEARDGIITSVTALHPEDLTIVWKGFAKRGIGIDAVAPAKGSTSLSGVVESYDIPSELMQYEERSRRATPPPRLVLFDLGNTLELRDRLRPGALEMLAAVQSLRDRNGGAPVLALLSDYFPAESEAHREEIREQYVDLLRRLGIFSYFAPVQQRVTLSTDLSLQHPAIAKPDARLFRLALNNVDPRLRNSDAIFITETAEHVTAAKDLGFEAIQIPTSSNYDLQSLVPAIREFVVGAERPAAAFAARAPARSVVSEASSSPSQSASDTRGISLTFGDKIFTITTPADDQARRSGRPADELRMQAPPDRLHWVIQIGRRFEQEHPEVRILVNRGRYLLVDWDPATEARDSEHRDFKAFSVTEDEVIFSRFDTQRLRQSPSRADWIEALLAKLDVDTYSDDVFHLASSFATRNSTTEHYANASAWAFQQLSEAGYETAFQSISVNGSVSRNVVAFKPGSAEDPDRFLIVAHLDSINAFGTQESSAPGADDNASGSAGLLQIARALRDHSAEHDLQFVLFGGEEQGLHGSQQFVELLADAEKQRIRGVVNMDMIGSMNQSPATVLIEGSNQSESMEELVEQLAAAAATYTDLAVELSFHPFASDHVPFLESGIPAALTIEGADSTNGNVHTINDTFEKIDAGFSIQVLRMNLAYIANSIGRADLSGR